MGGAARGSKVVAADPARYISHRLQLIHSCGAARDVTNASQHFRFHLRVLIVFELVGGFIGALFITPTCVAATPVITFFLFLSSRSFILPTLVYNFITCDFEASIAIDLTYGYRVMPSRSSLPVFVYFLLN